MSQMSFSDFEYAGKRKQTRHERFLAEMDRIVPWSGLLAHRAVLPEARRPKTLSAGNPAAHSSVAELVLPERSSRGRSALRNQPHAPLRMPDAAGYTAVEKRDENENRKVIWQIAARRSSYSKLYKPSVLYKVKREIEYSKAQTRAKVEHPFRVTKRQFGYVKVRFGGLMKNIAQLATLFALSNLRIARKQMMGMGELHG